MGTITGTVQRTVSLPLERVVAVERYCEKTDRRFSGAVSYLIKMGLVYVENVLPCQEVPPIRESREEACK